MYISEHQLSLTSLKRINLLQKRKHVSPTINTSKESYLAILIVADPWWGFSVPPILDTPDTHNSCVNSTADTVLQLDMQFGKSVFGVDGGFTNITDSSGFNHVTYETH
jgi:hypothetical protein